MLLGGTYGKYTYGAPASAGHHGNADGGLYDHSKMVTLELLDLTEKLGLKWGRPESPYIVGMFHDVCKADSYMNLAIPNVRLRAYGLKD